VDIAPYADPGKVLPGLTTDKNKFKKAEIWKYFQKIKEIS